jgi:hypothetical protein
MAVLNVDDIMLGTIEGCLRMKSEQTNVPYYYVVKQSEDLIEIYKKDMLVRQCSIREGRTKNSPISFFEYFIEGI